MSPKPQKHSTQSLHRSICAQRAAEWICRAYYADEHAQLENLSMTQQMRFHAAAENAIHELLTETRERA